MNPKHFGDSHDMAKRMIMRWLYPDGPWVAHPMWFNQRPEPLGDCDFLKRYATALNVKIVPNESGNRDEFLAVAGACTDHLLLDPDTGMWDGTTSREHVTVDEFVRIVTSPGRENRLALIFDQSYLRRRHAGDIWEQTTAKIDRMRQDNRVHAAAHIAHKGLWVRFIWASTNCELITNVTHRLQEQTGFPGWRLVDDGCGHVLRD